MKLNETVEMMVSDDYKERFKAEYYQVAIRYKKLKDMIDKFDSLPFTPTCPKSTYLMQLEAMRDYLAVLILRAEMEKIELKEI